MSNDDNLDPNMFDFGDDAADGPGDFEGLDFGDAAADTPADDAVGNIDVFGDGPSETPAPVVGESPAPVVVESSAVDQDEKPGKGKKKAKKSKPKKEGAGLSAADIFMGGICVLLLLALLGANAYVFMNHGAAIMFLVFMNLFGGLIVAVPFLMWRAGKKLTVYDVSLGLTVIALTAATLLLLMEIANYGGELRAAKASIQPPAANTLMDLDQPTSLTA